MENENQMGCMHIYCGDGKGKTTAAVGTAIRAAAAGYNVLIAQFLKNGSSSEISILKKLPNVEVVAYESLSCFSFHMSESEKITCKDTHNEMFNHCMLWARNGIDRVLILDELIGTLNLNLINEKPVMDFLRNRPPRIEILLTGRDPNPELLEMADYVSLVKMIKHPFNKGLKARKGVEL